MAGADALFVGRQVELSRIEALLSAAPPVALVLTGEPGIGKSMLWRAGIEHARAVGQTVLLARPVGEEHSLAFSGLADLLRTVSPELREGLPSPQRRALAAALLEDRTEGVVPDARTIGTAVLSVLRQLSGDGDVLVAVDDWQWLDGPTGGALVYALRRLERKPVRILATLREGEEPGIEAQTLRLAGLSIGAVHELLRTRLGLALDRPTLQRLHQVSGGNPFTALELGRVLSDGGPTRGRVPVADSLQQLLRRRITALPAPTRKALLELAAAVEPLPLGPALEPALEASLIEWDGQHARFAHPLYGETVYAAARPSARRAAHERLAGVARSPEARARHLALAAEGTDEEVARALSLAATDAAARGAVDRAAELARLAVEATADERRRAERLISAARFELRSGRESEATVLLDEALGLLPAGPQRAEGLILRCQSEARDLAALPELCEQAIAEAGADLRLVASAEVRVGEVQFVLGDLEAAVAAWRQAVVDADRAGAPDVVEYAEAQAALAERLLGRPVAPPPVPEFSEAFDSSGWLDVRGLCLLLDDRLDEGREELRRLADWATTVGNDLIRREAYLHLAELEVRAGRYGEARRAAHEALLQESGQGLAAALYAVALVDAYEGRVDEARAQALEAAELSRGTGDGIFWIQAESVLGFLELSLGEAAAAARRLGPLPAAVAATGCREPSLYQVLPNMAHALLELGEHEQARAYVDELEECGRAVDGAWSLAQAARLRGLLAAAEGDIEGALAHFERALAEHERLPVPFERGRTLLALGATLRRAKRKADARDALERAQRLFGELGAPLWVARTETELARISGRRRHDGALTETERRVAELVAEGRSNKEVAAALFVTVRTVESNLKRVYEKLGVRSRVELARRI